MGAYFGAFNADKREWFSGHDFESGAKWWETINGPPAAALLTLLKVIEGKGKWVGRWAGDRVVVCGDYGLCWGEVLEEIEIEYHGAPRTNTARAVAGRCSTTASYSKLY